MVETVSENGPSHIYNCRSIINWITPFNWAPNDNHRPVVMMVPQPRFNAVAILQ